MKKLFFLNLFLVGFSFCSVGQLNTDTEFWLGGTVKFKLSNSLKLDIQEQFRFNNNASSFSSSFTEVGLKYKVNKILSFKANFRHNVKANKKNRVRGSIDMNLNLSKKQFPLSLIYRLRFQNTNVLNSTKRYTVIRNKIGLKYNASKLVDPYASYELYYRLNGKNEFRTKRLTLGLQWRLLKELRMTTFYRLQTDINVKNPDRSHIIGLMFTYNLDVRKRR